MEPRPPAGEAGVIAGHRDLELRCRAVPLCDRERASRTRRETAAEDRVPTFDVTTLDPDLGLCEAQQRQRAPEHDPDPGSFRAGANEPSGGALELFPVPPSEVFCSCSGHGDEGPRQLDVLDRFEPVGGWVRVSHTPWLIRECVATVSLLDLGIIFEGARYSDHRDCPDRPAAERRMGGRDRSRVPSVLAPVTSRVPTGLGGAAGGRLADSRGARVARSRDHAGRRGDGARRATAPGDSGRMEGRRLRPRAATRAERDGNDGDLGLGVAAEVAPHASCRAVAEANLRSSDRRGGGRPQEVRRRSCGRRFRGAPAAKALLRLGGGDGGRLTAGLGVRGLTCPQEDLTGMARLDRFVTVDAGTLGSGRVQSGDVSSGKGGHACPPSRRETGQMQRERARARPALEALPSLVVPS